MNNSGLSFEYHEQRYRHGGRVIAEANNFTDVNYGAVATGFGAKGVQVTTRSEFEREFKTALDSANPTVIDVVVDREAFPPVTNFDQHFKRKI